MSVNFNLIISDIYVRVYVVFIFNSTHTNTHKSMFLILGFVFLFLTVGANSVLVWCLMCVWMFQLIKSNSMNWWLRSTLKKKNFDNKMMIVVVVISYCFWFFTLELTGFSCLSWFIAQVKLPRNRKWILAKKKTKWN